MKIIFEDNHIIVVEKPFNVPTQQDDSKDLDMLTLIKKYLKEKYNKPGNVFLGLVHRLDRPVGGVMIFAKTSKAASRLSEQIRSREFKKVYFAVVSGKPKDTDTLQHYLVKNEVKNIVYVSSEKDKNAKQAILDYKVNERTDKYSLVTINLHTGRPHQIRVQFAAIGCPLYGDQKYNANSKEGEQLALWSHEITFRHPISKELMTFQSNPKGISPWSIFNIAD